MGTSIIKRATRDADLMLAPEFQAVAQILADATAQASSTQRNIPPSGSENFTKGGKG